MIIFLTGLSGAGKTILANSLHKDIKKKNPNTVWIDGDVLRQHFKNTKKYDQKSRMDQYKNLIVQKRIRLLVLIQIPKLDWDHSRSPLGAVQQHSGRNKPQKE